MEKARIYLFGLSSEFAVVVFDGKRDTVACEKDNAQMNHHLRELTARSPRLCGLSSEFAVGVFDGKRDTVACEKGNAQMNHYLRELTARSPRHLSLPSASLTANGTPSRVKKETRR